MLPTTLWAYQIAYKVSTQHKPYELIWVNAIITYWIIVLTNQTFSEKDGSWMNALLVWVENLVLHDEKRIIAWENIGVETQ
jgi:hypothetical protein